MSKKKVLIAALAGLSLMITCFAQPSDQSSAQPGPPQELNADEVEYDMETGLARASGNVRIKRGNVKDPNAEPSSIAADQVDYNMNDGTITAEGNVLLRHEGGMATGARAMYNTDTQAAHLIGNVIVVRDGVRLTCDQLINDGYGHMQADGNVYAEQKVEPTPEKPEGDFRTFNGEHVDYYPNDRGHVVISTGGIAKSNDGTFSADYMEGWLDDQYYVGQGNAHLVSPPKKIEAGGDRIDYYAQEHGKAVLTGNAWAVQENNQLRGNRVTVYLADEPRKSASAQNASGTRPIDRNERIKPNEAPINPNEQPTLDAPFQTSETSVEQSIEQPNETFESSEKDHE